MKTRVAIVEDNLARREMLKMLVDSSATFECSGVYSDGRDIVSQLKQNPADVVLMDINMPYVNGIEALKAIRAALPQVKIIMQTVFEDEEKIFEAVIEGAQGYILKNASADKLLEAIDDVVKGGSPMTPTVASQVLRLFRSKHERKSHQDFSLSVREQEILSLLVQGLSYKMIADKCHISYSTVNTHISHIYEKLHVSSGPQAVAKALEMKLG